MPGSAFQRCLPSIQAKCLLHRQQIQGERGTKLSVLLEKDEESGLESCCCSQRWYLLPSAAVSGSCFHLSKLNSETQNRVKEMLQLH